MGFVKEPHENYALELLYSFVKDHAYMTYNDHAEARQAYEYLRERIPQLQMYELKHIKDKERREIDRQLAEKNRLKEGEQKEPVNEPQPVAAPAQPVVTPTPPVDAPAQEEPQEERQEEPQEPVDAETAPKIAPPVRQSEEQEPVLKEEDQEMIERMLQIKQRQDMIRRHKESAPPEPEAPAPPRRSP